MTFLPSTSVRPWSLYSASCLCFMSITARGFDRLVRALVDDLGITVLMATHDLDTLLTVVDRVIVLSRGRVLADGSVREVTAVDDEWVRRYFSVRTMTQGDLGDGS